MTIEQIKANLQENKGRKVNIIFDIGRNKTEEFEAIISELYPAVFVVLKDNEKKSFSYADVLTNTVMLQMAQNDEKR